MKYSKVLSKRLRCRACGGSHVSSTQVRDDRGKVHKRNVCLNGKCRKVYK